MNSLSLQIEETTDYKQELKSQINAKFNKLISAISNKQEMIMKQIEDHTQAIQSQIIQKSQTLKQQQVVTTNTISACNDLLSNKDMSSFPHQRKQQIMLMADDILQNNTDSFRHDTIKCVFNDMNLLSVRFYIHKT